MILSQDFAWRPADDLVAADLDRDGDLDVVTVSMDAPGAVTEAEVLTNDGTGTLVDLGISRPLGDMARKVVRVIHPYDTKTPVLVVFGVLPGNVPALLAFDAAAGLTTTVLPGVNAVAGDWEAGDLNADGYTDLVALGFDASGVDGLSVFWGAPAGWTRQNVEAYVSVTKANVDVGDFDSDARADIFVMFEAAGLTRVTKLLRNTGANFTSSATAGQVEYQVAQGDGFIIDTANDALAEVVAMGRTADDAISGWYLRNDKLIGSLEDTAVVAMDPLADTDTAWGDFDADGDLDAFQVGHDDGFRIVDYENHLGTYIDQNDAPKAPTNVSAVYDAARGGFVFSWSPPIGSNDETPTVGFGYELRIGTTATGMQVLSWAHSAGASQQGQSLQRFVRMPFGVYWYDVRTVDSGWKRSKPAGVAKQTAP